MSEKIFPQTKNKSKTKPGMAFPKVLPNTQKTNKQTKNTHTLQSSIHYCKVYRTRGKISPKPAQIQSQGN